MNSRNPLHATILAATLALTSAAGVMPATAHSPTLECPTAQQTNDGEVDVSQVDEGTDANDCNLIGLIITTESDDGGPTLGVEVPEPGHFVEFSAFGTDEDADSSQLFVGVRPDGTLDYSAVNLAAAAGAPDACDDSAYNTLNADPSMPSGETYYINKSTIPSYLNEADAVAAILDGVRAWPQLVNNCGLADNVGVTSHYGGNGEGTNSVVEDYCRAEGYDSYSVIGFGNIVPVGGTCRGGNYVGGSWVTTGADIKFDTSLSWTVTGGSAACSNKVDLESVTAHEAGHFWGMDHVSATTHPHLTMRNGGMSAITCNTKLRSLGRGDVLGMRNIYN